MKNIRVFTDYQVSELLKNPNVLKVINSSQVIYKDDFKLWSVFKKKMHPELTAKEIFEMAGFDTKLLHPETPRKRIAYWSEQIDRFGVEVFLNKKQYNSANTINDNDYLISCLEENNKLLNLLIDLLERFL